MGRLLLAFVGLAINAGCVSGIDVADASFPCRVPEDCIEGFVCDPVRFVCVESNAPVDAGVADEGPVDAGANDLGL